MKKVRKDTWASFEEHHDPRRLLYQVVTPPAPSTLFGSKIENKPGDNIKYNTERRNQEQNVEIKSDAGFIVYIILILVIIIVIINYGSIRGNTNSMH